MQRMRRSRKSSVRPFSLCFLILIFLLRRFESVLISYMSLFFFLGPQKQFSCVSSHTGQCGITGSSQRAFLPVCWPSLILILLILILIRAAQLTDGQFGAHSRLTSSNIFPLLWAQGQSPGIFAARLT